MNIIALYEEPSQQQHASTVCIHCFFFLFTKSVITENINFQSFCCCRKENKLVDHNILGT